MINPFENELLIIFIVLVTATAAGFDIVKHKIPNMLNFPAMLGAVVYFTALHGWDGFVFSACGMLTGIALLLLPYLMGGMGAGDAKLMGAVGACLGTEHAIKAFIYVAAMGCVYALIVMIAQRSRMKGYFKQLWLTAQAVMLTRHYVPVESSDGERPKVYYGVAIAAGTLLYLSAEFTSVQALI